MRVMVPVAVIVSLLIMTIPAWAKHAPHLAPDISGYWYTEGHEGVVRLYSCADKVCGELYWMEASDVQNASLDTRNPDPVQRDRPLCHMQFMGGFTSDGHGHYNDGWIYSPRHGATFNADMTLASHDTLVLHGYLLLSFLGEDQTWTRVPGHPQSCMTRHS